MAGGGPHLFSSPEPAVVPAQKALGALWSQERPDPSPDWHGFKLEVVGGGGKGSNAKRSFTFCATWSNQVCAKHHHSLRSDVLSASFGEEAEVVKAFAPMVLSPEGEGRRQHVRVSSSDWARKVPTLQRGGTAKGLHSGEQASRACRGRGGPSGGLRVDFFETGWLWVLGKLFPKRV